jgi:cytochrome oxidase Cu insertion factor (SCO1/SenC/PrrC family)
MAIQKCTSIKGFLTVFFLAIRLTLFSQLSHEDSMTYQYNLKAAILVGNDLRGKTIPDFVVKDKTGKLFTNDNFRSKITFINFWFEACAPCLTEFQALEKFYNKNKSRDNFQFISITWEQDSVIEQVRKKIILPIQFIIYP